MIRITVTYPGGAIATIEVPLNLGQEQASAVVTKDEPVKGAEDAFAALEKAKYVLMSDKESTVATWGGDEKGEIGRIGGVGERKESGEREGEPESESGSSDITAFLFPCEDGYEWSCSRDLARDFLTAFGRDHVEKEFLKARMWLLANPERRKTRRGMGRFLQSWLCRQQNIPRQPIKTLVQDSLLADGNKTLNGW